MSAIVLKTTEEIELMRESALIVSKTLGMLAAEIKPGISTLALDAMAETFIRDHGAEPGFLGLMIFQYPVYESQYPGGTRDSNNDPLQEGDIISTIVGHLKTVLWRSCVYFCRRRN